MRDHEVRTYVALAWHAPEVEMTPLGTVLARSYARAKARARERWPEIGSALRIRAVSVLLREGSRTDLVGRALALAGVA